MIVQVVNRSDEELEDGFAGVRYRFPVGEPVEIPVEAARHIFGYGEEDREPFLVRLGWIETRNDLPKGLKRLNKFEITEPNPTHNALSPVVTRVPLPDRRRGGGKASERLSA